MALPRASEAGARSDCGEIARALGAVLQGLRSVVAEMSDQDYVAPAAAVLGGSALGSHVRHCLDHARALLDGWNQGVVDYDARQRGTEIERSPRAADSELSRLMAMLPLIAERDASEPVQVRLMPTRDAAGTTLVSTLGRELAFVLSHTIHHNATIRGIAISLGCPVDDAFGFAPSTLAHKDRSACAPSR